MNQIKFVSSFVMHKILDLGHFWKLCNGGPYQILNHQYTKIQSPKLNLIHSLILVQCKGTKRRTWRLHNHQYKTWKKLKKSLELKSWLEANSRPKLNVVLLLDIHWVYCNQNQALSLKVALYMKWYSHIHAFFCQNLCTIMLIGPFRDFLH